MLDKFFGFCFGILLRFFFVTLLVVLFRFLVRWVFGFDFLEDWLVSIFDVTWIQMAKGVLYGKDSYFWQIFWAVAFICSFFGKLEKPLFYIKVDLNLK